MANIKANEPLASAPSTSFRSETFDKPPADDEKAPKPANLQEASAVGKAQREQQPAKYDNAPPAVQGVPESTAIGRDKWPELKLTIKELGEATSVRARTKDPESGGVYVAGSYVTKDGVVLSPARIARRGDSFLAALLEDQSIELKLEK